ncbi:hypothetical protein ZWY2020_009391 [Hordeum vulgare]|nr:hypothetical protein ZWY2020_009391 [Hordeum vulgare]
MEFAHVMTIGDHVRSQQLQSICDVLNINMDSTGILPAGTNNGNAVADPDSSALSLLMDNKGLNPLDGSITAPDYVILAGGTVHAEANNHNETQVTVSISETMNDMAIVLKVTAE